MATKPSAPDLDHKAYRTNFDKPRNMKRALFTIAHLIKSVRLLKALIRQEREQSEEAQRLYLEYLGVEREQQNQLAHDLRIARQENDRLLYEAVRWKKFASDKAEALRLLAKPSSRTIRRRQRGKSIPDRLPEVRGGHRKSRRLERRTRHMRGVRED